MMSVMPFTSAQAPAKTSNVAVRVRKNWPLTQKASQNHQAAADQAEPPHVVQRPLGERLNRPEKPDHQEHQAEDVGEPGEGLFGPGQGDDSGGG